MPGLWGTGDGNQDIVHAKQALHQLNNAPNPFPHFRDEEIELSRGHSEYQTEALTLSHWAVLPAS